MFRKLSKNGLQLIKKLEGCELIAYKDSGGVYTIGYGHTKNVKRGMTITQKQAEVFLKEDCNKFVDHVNKYMNTYNFNQNQFDALVSFAFNIGSINEIDKYYGNNSNLNMLLIRMSLINALDSLTPLTDQEKRSYLKIWLNLKI